MSDEDLEVRRCGAIRRTDDRPCRRIDTVMVGPVPLCSHHERSLDNALIRHRNQADEIRGEQLRERAAEKLACSVVYFAEREGFVKIGKSEKLASRLRDIGRGSALPAGLSRGPLRLMATIPGGLDRERWMHLRWAHLRVEGEWFLPDAEMRRFIDGLRGRTNKSWEEHE